MSMTAEQLCNERKRINNVMILSLTPREIEAIKEITAEAYERGRFEAYEKARELVGFSPSACHAIEAQMQQEFPDRPFVEWTRISMGSRMDGANMRMPKTPHQVATEARERGRVEMREKCDDTIRKRADWYKRIGRPDHCDVLLRVSDEIAALPTSSEEPAPSQEEDQ